MTPLPLTVIGGYLGAGKTTLINRLLSEKHGLRILVLVNDFGAINIDAKLLVSASEDTIELANGCVCCTMGADLFMAVGDALDRRPRPDHLIIEASGIADPARIARVASAEPELTYAGIVTVVDGDRFLKLLADPQISSQIEGQIKCADILAISKLSTPAILNETLVRLNPQANQISTEALEISAILMAQFELQLRESPVHAAYHRWSHSSECEFDTSHLASALRARPAALYRVKGRLRGIQNSGVLVQVVGNDIRLTEIEQPERSEMIGIGLAQTLSLAECDVWSNRKLLKLQSERTE